MENVETENFMGGKGKRRLGKMERWKLGESCFRGRESLDPQVNSTPRVASRFDLAPLQGALLGGYSQG
jgi:hypothetical protein